MSDDDARLARMLAGDEDAFRAIYRSIQPGLLRYLTVLVGAGEAEDVAADAWAEALRDLDRFSGTLDGFRGWISTIARHRGLDLLRRRARRPVVDSDLEGAGVLAAQDAAEIEAMTLVSTEEAMRMIAALPPDQAEAVLLRAVIGLDARTAGAVLGKRPGAVRTAAYRGLKRLAENLSSFDSEISRTTDADRT